MTIQRIFIFSASIILLFGALVVTVDVSPATGAAGADFLRKIVGVAPVGRLEESVYQTQDTIERLEYRLGMKKAMLPWAQSAPASLTTVTYSPPTATSQSASPSPSPTAQSVVQYAAVAQKTEDGIASTPSASPPNPTDTPTLTVATWTPPPVTALEHLADEGVWQPYIQDPAGQVVAYRTFVAPDPQRPYVLVAVVAFDLQQANLHFILGYDEPYAKKETTRSNGIIPQADLQSGKIIAAFNGGFQVEHGFFGAMVNGLVGVPPTYSLGTVAIYTDGSLRLGEWGADIRPSNDIVAYRQNGPLAIKDGHLSPPVEKDSYWGYTLSGETVTWRSGMGISPDGRSLYYFAGPTLTIRTLANAMIAAGVKNAIQLDINSYSTHFVAVHYTDGNPVCVPLFDKYMTTHINRYLRGFSRDYFYVTLK